MILICDSDCELWYTRADALDLKLIEMPYIIDGEEFLYQLGRIEDAKVFFDKMRKGAKASTAAQNGAYYRDFFEPFFKAGEEMLYIAFSSKMSGTFDYLDMTIRELQEEYPDARYVRFDTLNISMGAGIQVYLGAKYAREGHTLDETVAYLENLRSKVHCTFAVENLEYLKRGGRISPVAAAFGTILQLKPVLKISEEGTIDVATKAKGTKKAIEYMLTNMFQSDVDTTKPITVLHGDCVEKADKMIEKLREQYGNDIEIWCDPIGPVIGSHCGPDTIGIIYVTK